MDSEWAWGRRRRGADRIGNTCLIEPRADEYILSGVVNIFVLVLVAVHEKVIVLLPELFCFKTIVASVPIPVMVELFAVVYPWISRIPDGSLEKLNCGKNPPFVTDTTSKSAPA